MAEAADPLDGDEISWASATVAESIESGDAGAKKRGSFSGVERVWHSGDSFGGSEHVFSVAAVIADAGDFFVHAGNEIAAAALQASSVVAAVPADADALTLVPIRDAGADFIDDAGNFVAGRAWISDAGKQAVFDDMVAEADTARL